MSDRVRKFELEFLGEKDFECEADGTTTRRVWGYIHESNGPTLAAYWMEWTVDRVSQLGARLDLVVGKWGEQTSNDDRVAVALLHRQKPDGGPELMVIDSESEIINTANLASVSLNRSDVINTPLADHVFALVDAIYELDGRILR